MIFLGNFVKNKLIYQNNSIFNNLKQQPTYPLLIQNIKILQINSIFFTYFKLIQILILLLAYYWQFSFIKTCKNESSYLKCYFYLEQLFTRLCLIQRDGFFILLAFYQCVCQQLTQYWCYQFTSKLYQLMHIYQLKNILKIRIFRFKTNNRSKMHLQKTSSCQYYLLFKKSFSFIFKFRQF
ncbi:hypothetical protein ABPG72_008829 [Tetrahymena utriculariae]